MTERFDIISSGEVRFREIAVQILEHAGFTQYFPEKKLFKDSVSQRLLKKDKNIYYLGTFSSRRAIYTSRSILKEGDILIQYAKEKEWLPLIVVGGELPPSLKAELLGISIRTVILGIQNLLYMARSKQEMYDELVAYLPYSVQGLIPMEPDYLPMPDWNKAYGGEENWRDITVTLGQERRRSVASRETRERQADDELFEFDDWEDDWDGGELLPHRSEGEQKPSAKPKPSPVSVIPGTLVDSSGSMHLDKKLTSTGALANLLIAMQTMGEQERTENLRKDLQKWQGGRQTNSAAYEKLCTRTLMRLFADDLTLWKEQARSNDDLFRFDLICKIKRDNHKDFWEIVERYFNSKYIIFEFKNYAGKVTQKEVYTTVRYLYPTALRRVAVIVSPNGIDDHADKAIRGALRDEGKLILSLTNDELIEMLRMKEYGEDPVDYLNDKLDALLIDLEK